MKGSGGSVLADLSPRMLEWVKEVSEGHDPYEMAKRIYSDCLDVAVLVEELYAHPKVKLGLRVLLEQSLRTRLLKIIADPEAKHADVLMAAKQLDKLDFPREDDNKKNAFLPKRGEDPDLDAKMRELGEKAKLLQ